MEKFLAGKHRAEHPPRHGARSRRGPLSQAGSERCAFYRGTEGDMLRSIRDMPAHTRQAAMRLLLHDAPA
ncbi:hypothetical protein [Xanthomonas sp. SS]|uniref:hypothetical protein n=1 Tax=Xanthomonas sp. SS TaxID=2724122 RepID=UPI00163A1C89|nr:hypothetical protein [Xanthomonas sp. SS]